MFHWDLEPWAVFRALPEVINQKRRLDKFFQDVETGYALLPQQNPERTPPSLWAYYSTLPAWCRDHSAIRTILFAFEYHKP